MVLSKSQSRVNFHISLNVSDIPRSVDFFSKLFGVEPAKQRADYAKFELENPPLTLSLEPVAPQEHGALNHVGFRLNNAEDLVALQRSLEMAGISSEREEGVECCYAKQSKFWLHDPDNNLWEMYILEGDLEHRGAGQAADTVQGVQKSAAGHADTSSIVCSAGQPHVASQRWAHRLGNPLSIPSEYTSESLDAIALQGTFNAEGTESEIKPFLEQVADRLKPGGKLTVHCLTSDIPVTEPLQLSGPASVVKSVPCLESLLDHLEAACFEAIRLQKFGSRACFTVGAAELRETLIQAQKPVQLTEKLVSVVYQGPFPELPLDNGLTLRRGRKTTLSESLYQELQSTSAGDSLVLMETATSPVACSG